MKMCAGDIEFTLIRSDRKTADIVIERSGDIIVRAPVEIDDDKIREIVADRELWVHRSLTEWVELNASRMHRPLAQGQGFTYLGRSYRLKFVGRSDVPLRLKYGRWELSEPFFTEHGEVAVRKAFRDFYIAKGKQNSFRSDRLFRALGRSCAKLNRRQGAWILLGLVRKVRGAEFQLEDGHGSPDRD